MTASIQHRGPDAEGLCTLGPVGFGFRRLSILDLSPSGHQPMATEDGQVVLVFNGEIYNFVEVRNDLIRLGHSFRSSGDTEVLLHAYLEWGRECLKRLNGMWAFLLYDKRKELVFGSRDRFGKKPFFRYRSRDWLFYASEIKAIQESGFYKAEPNWKIVSRYFYEDDSLDEPDEHQDTFYSGIKEVPAGSAFEVDLKGRTTAWFYWSLSQTTQACVTDPVRSFREVFEDAIRIRMRSDVPIGVCLSGGMDSTSIICVMADELRRGNEHTSGQLAAFSYISPEFDESTYIEDTIKYTGALLHKADISPLRLWDNMEKVVGYHDEPLHSMTPLVGYELYKLAADNGIKVILNGQGADETLAGYHSYCTNYWYSLLRSGKLKLAWNQIAEFCLGHDKDQKSFFLKTLRHFSRSQLRRFSVYRKLAHSRKERRNLNNRWFRPELAAFLQREEEPFVEPHLTTALQRSVTHFPLPLYLRVEDRNSMAHSVEARLPFLDYRLVELEFSLPDNLKLFGAWNKFVLRQAMRNRIPESVRGRMQKLGFPVAQGKWFSANLSNQIQDLLESQALRERGIYDLQAIEYDLRLHNQGKIDISSQLFKVIQFEVWSKINSDRNRLTRFAI